MKIVDLSVSWTIILNIVAWFVIHIAVAFFASKLPNRIFLKDSVLTRTRSWERGGKIWDDFFKVKNWKYKLPDGAVFFKKGFRKRNLNARDSEYYRQFILETRRAELTHWITIVPSIIFFLWNPFWAGWFIVLYALSVNLPCIITQRYNRPRLVRMINGRGLVRWSQ